MLLRRSTLAHWMLGTAPRRASSRACWLLCLLGLAVLSLFTTTGASSTTLIANETRALRDLYEATEGSGWSSMEVGWDFRQLRDGSFKYNPCSSKWSGVYCSSTAGPIVRLSLSAIGLAGNIPSSLGVLGFLTNLDLSGNFLTGSLTPGLSRLTRLVHLDLDSNQLTGSDRHFNQFNSTLPSELSQLTNLQVLNFNTNQLTGTLAVWLGDLRGLTTLDFGANHLRSSLPSELGQLTNLVYLNLNYNNLLAGPLPPWLGGLYWLTLLHLGTNSFHSTLPRELAQLTNCVSLNLAYNGITGSLPQWFAELKALKVLYLSSNHFTSTLPLGLGQLTNLELLALENNEFTGSLGGWLGGLQALTFLTLEGNSFSSSLPPELGQLTNLQNLALDSNAFTGCLPEWFGNYRNLTVLTLDSNSFTSSITSALGMLTKLKVLDLESNSLTGTLPNWLGNLCSLSVLTLGGNSFRSTLIPELGQLTELVTLSLHDNALTGSVGAWLGGLRSLTFLDLGSNFFRSSLPQELGQLTNLEVLELSRNALSGSVGGWLGGLRSLTLLYLNDNNFRSSLPPELGQLTNLKDLALSSNALTGDAFPPNLYNGMTSLKFLHLSNNSFEGSVSPSLALLNASLVEVSVSSNRLTSTLPSELAALTNLKTLDLSGNAITGPLPSNFGALSSLQTLRLSGNRISGSLSPALCSWNASLVSIDLSNNLLVGPVLQCLAAFRNLSTLQLSQNRLTNGGKMAGSGLDFLLGPNLTVVDVSNNRLEGILPPAVFASPRLQIFAAAANCLHGELPLTLCQATSLQTLVLDGMSSGESCQAPIWSQPNLLGFTATRALGRVGGSLPACLFYALPNITTLHLSGLDLMGRLPETLTAWPSGLTDLSLSHNALTGSLSVGLQRQMGQFAAFDVSFGKLGGLLQDVRLGGNGATQRLQTLRLKVNRFSGLLSHNIVTTDAPNVAVLEGNLIDCSAHDKQQLPVLDVFYGRFKCGSTTFNAYMYALAVALVFACTLLLQSAKGGTLLMMKYLLPPTKLDGRHSSVQRLLETLAAARRFAVASLICGVLALLPVYGSLSAFQGTSTQLYAWTVSAGFKSGNASAGVLLSIWTACLVLAFHGLSVPWSSSAGPGHSTTLQRQLCASSTEDGERSVKDIALSWLRLAAVVCINAVCVLGPNVAFVYVESTFGNSAQTAASLCLTIYKLAWNRSLLPWLLDARRLHFLPSGEEAPREGERLLELVLAACNHIVAPSIALMLADSNCFFHALYSPEAVTATYQTPVLAFVSKLELELGCTEGGATFKTTVKADTAYNQTNTVSYQPSFQYSYMCSSTLLQTYASVFLLSAIISAFGEAALHLSVRALVNRRPSTGRWLLPRVLRTREERSQERSRSGGRRDFAKNGYRVANARAVLSALLQDVAILLTFGTVMPLLGLAVLASIVSRSLRWHHMVVAFLESEKERSGRKDASPECKGEDKSDSEEGLAALVADCAFLEREASLVYRSRWPLLLLASLFLSFFLEDMAGDVSGWAPAVWAPVLMCTLPVSITITARAVSGMRKEAVMEEGPVVELSVARSPLPRASHVVNLVSVYGDSSITSDTIPMAEADSAWARLSAGSEPAVPTARAVMRDGSGARRLTPHNPIEDAIPNPLP